MVIGSVGTPAIAVLRSGIAARQLAILTRTAPQPLAHSVRSLHTTSRRLAPAFTPPPPNHATTSTPTSSSSPSPSSKPPSHNVGRTTNVKHKELPKVPNTLPYLAAFVAAAIASWGGFTIYATNKEKLSSSIFKSVVGQVKNSSEVQALLSPPSGGVVPVLKRETWLGGMCRVKGSVNMMQGRVDLSFKITTPENISGKENGGGKAEVGTVYFTSIRAHKHAPFEILRFVVVNDKTGESVSLLEKGGLSSIDVDSGDIV